MLDRNLTDRVTKTPRLSAVFKEKYAEHRELDWLVYDWKNDPAFASKSDLLKNILAEQNTALARLEAEEPIFKVMQDFVIASKILETDLASIKLLPEGELLPASTIHPESESLPEAMH